MSFFSLEKVLQTERYSRWRQCVLACPRTVKHTDLSGFWCCKGRLNRALLQSWQLFLQLRSEQCLMLCGHGVSLLVHGQVTIIFVVSVGLSVCLFVCLCRVLLSRLWSDFDQTRSYVICLDLVVSPRIYGLCDPWGWMSPKNLYF